MTDVQKATAPDSAPPREAEGPGSLKAWAVPLLRSVGCGSAVVLHVFESNARGDTLTGVLRCGGSQCRLWYPVVRGIPRMLPADLRQELTRDFEQRFHAALTALDADRCGARPSECVKKSSPSASAISFQQHHSRILRRRLTAES